MSKENVASRKLADELLRELYDPKNIIKGINLDSKEQERIWREMGISPELGFNGHDDNREIVKSMIKRHGHALRHASIRLQNDKELVILAINDSPMAFMNATPEMRNCKDVALAAFKKTSVLLGYASEEIQALCEGKNPIKALETAIFHENLNAKLSAKPEVRKPKMKI